MAMTLTRPQSEYFCDTLVLCLKCVSMDVLMTEGVSRPPSKELEGRVVRHERRTRGQHAGPWAVPFPSRGLDRPPSGYQAHRPSTIFALFPYGPAGPRVR